MRGIHVDMPENASYRNSEGEGSCRAYRPYHEALRSCEEQAKRLASTSDCITHWRCNHILKVWGGKLRVCFYAQTIPPYVHRNVVMVEQTSQPKRVCHKPCMQPADKYWKCPLCHCGCVHFPPCLILFLKTYAVTKLERYWVYKYFSNYHTCIKRGLWWPKNGPWCLFFLLFLAA